MKSGCIKQLELKILCHNKFSIHCLFTRKKKSGKDLYLAFLEQLLLVPQMVHQYQDHLHEQIACQMDILIITQRTNIY